MWPLVHPHRAHPANSSTKTFLVTGINTFVTFFKILLPPLQMVLCCDFVLPNNNVIFASTVIDDLLAFLQVSHASFQQALIQQGHFLLGADPEGRLTRLRLREHQGSLEGCSRSHGEVQRDQVRWNGYMTVIPSDAHSNQNIFIHLWESFMTAINSIQCELARGILTTFNIVWKRMPDKILTSCFRWKLKRLILCRENWYLV